MLIELFYISGQITDKSGPACGHGKSQAKCNQSSD